MIPANVAITALTTGLTFLGWYLFNQVFFLELSISKTPQLITAMSALALIQQNGRNRRVCAEEERGARR